MPYLLDTNICIYVIKQRPAQVIDRFRQLSSGDLAVSSVTVFELAFGAQKSQHKSQALSAMRAFLTPLRILPFDSEDAMEAAAIRADLTRQGQPIGPYDLQIAGQARRLALVLVTNNLWEFERVAGLRSENWC